VPLSEVRLGLSFPKLHLQGQLAVQHARMQV
jgi:hypothetical protein